MTILDDKGLPAQQGNICDINNKKSLIVISEVSLEKGKKAFPFIKREHEYSNAIALEGFTEKEAEIIFSLLQKVRKNVEKDWEYVKKGNKRNY